MSEEFKGYDSLNRVYFPRLLRADASILKAANIKDENGNYLELGITEDGYIEVAAGIKYKGLLNVGDIFTRKVVSNPKTPTKYVVKCFIGENQKWFSDTIGKDTVLEELDTYFISPIDIKEYSGFESATILNNLYFFGSRKQAENIVEFAKNRDVYVRQIQFDDYLKRCNSSHAESYSFCYILSVMMFIIVTTGIIIFSLVMWMVDSRDIGILLSNGFAYTDVMKVIIYENTLKLVLPYIYLIYYLFFRGHWLFFEIEYLVKIAISLIVLFLAATIICSFASYAYIRTKMPDKLLKGETV